MHKATITFVTIVMLVFVPMAVARPDPEHRTTKTILASQTQKLAHAIYVCKYGDNYNQRWNCKAKIWLLREWKETYAKLHPDIRTYVKMHHPCLAGIIAVEDKTYDPTLSYGGGHGQTDVPYGLPQANPGRKMQSAGKDWATNPWTQLKWMIKYVRNRYGGECQALSFRMSHGSY